MNHTPDNGPEATDTTDAEQAPVVTGADSELLSRVADFWKAYRVSETTDETTHRLYAGIKAPLGAAHSPENELWKAEAERSGYTAAHNASHEANVKMGAAANAVFSIPAHTLRGCLEKVKIARLATGSGDDYNGDGDLECYQDMASPWVDNAIADLERLAGGVS